MALPLLELDGSLGEGGGQILRTCLTLSLLTGRPFRLLNIRAGRPKPGLQPQHLASVRAAATIGKAHLRGDSLNSAQLTFEPGEVKAGKYRIPIGTAGATGLVLHTVYLPLALRGGGDSELTLEGGTHVKASPCFHFLDTTWRAYMELLGISVRLQLKRPGFYPRGGGRVDVQIRGICQVRPLQLPERSEITRAHILSAVADLPETIAHRQARRALQRLKPACLQVEVSEETWQGGPGTLLAVTLQTKPVPTLYFGLGERGKPAERVADEAADQVFAYLDASPAAVDEHSADQLALPLALAPGQSDFKVTAVTRHLLTNVDVIRRFVERDITVEGEEGLPGRVLI
jgi:RNA 3'-terminal phosphate cyclase (ATP)